jgi:hypothetical protein
MWILSIEPKSDVDGGWSGKQGGDRGWIFGAVVRVQGRFSRHSRGTLLINRQLILVMMHFIAENEIYHFAFHRISIKSRSALALAHVLLQGAYGGL